MLIQIQLNKICKKLPYEELKKTKKIVQKLKNHGTGTVQNYLIFVMQLQLLPVPSSFHFFSFFLNLFPLGSGYGSR